MLSANGMYSPFSTPRHGRVAAAGKTTPRHDRGEAGNGFSHKLLCNNNYCVEKCDQRHDVTKPRRDLQGGVRKGGDTVQAELDHLADGILRFPGVSFLPFVPDPCLPEADPAYEAPNKTVPFPNLLEFVNDTATHEPEIADVDRDINPRYLFHD